MKKNSWHYQCAKIANDNCDIRDGEMSICQYTRKVAWGAFMFILMIAVVLGLAALLCVGVYQIAGILFGFASFGPPAIITSIVLCLILLAVGHALFTDYTKSARRNLMRKDNSTFIAKVYRSYKEKVCFPVEFEEDK